MLGTLHLLADPFPSAGAPPARAVHPGTPIMGLFARLTEAVGGGVCYHNECCQGETFLLVWQLLPQSNLKLQGLQI